MASNTSPSRLSGLIVVGLASAFLGLFLAPIASAQDEPTLVPPPVPDVLPIVTYPHDVDTDLDQLDDVLNERLTGLKVRIAATADAAERAALVQELQEPVSVETLFSEQITHQDLNAFIRLGGRVRYIFKHVSYGWWGEIPLGAVERVPRAMGRSFLALVAARPVHALMDEATRTGRVRPVWAAGFAGFGSGFSGSSTTSIAIMDTGVDGTHTDLSGRMVYWRDWIYGSGTPTDVNGHGSHVAGIALGTGAASGSSPTTVLYTDSDDATPLSGGSFFPSPIHIPAGSASIQMTATFWGGGQATLGYVYADNGSDSWTLPGSGTGPSPLSRSYSFTATSGRRYSVYFTKSSGSVTRYAVATTATAAGLGDGFNLLRGVAPGTRWVGQRILDDSGGGNTGTWGSAMDDCVANRLTYNIKVANMSVGTTSPFSPIRDKVNTMAANGIVPVVAAGNSGPSGVMYDPARARLALTVVSSNDINQITDYSSHGNFTQESNTDTKPDLTAPGGSWYHSLIMSVDTNTADAGSSSFADVRANDYANHAGTSMAAPFAAGAAALVIQALETGGLSWNYNSDAHPRLVKMLLCATATETNAAREAGGNNPTLGRAATPKDNFEGYGMINTDAAVEAAYQAITPGETINGTTTGGQYDRRAWGRKLSLTSGVQVTLNLTVPGTGDYDLYLYSGTPDSRGNPVILASSTSAGNGVNESIVHTPAAGGTAYLVIKRVSGSGAWSLTFAGGAAGITVTSPNGGESWAVGSARSVTWTYTGDPGPNVAVELLKGGSLHRTLSASTPIGSGGSGSYAWTIADDLTPASDYRILVRSTSTSASDTSNADFTISKAATTTAVAGVAGKIGQTVNLQATLTRDTDNAPLGSRSIAFQVDGSSAGSSNTNSSGIATRAYSIPEALGTGGKTIRADFAGDTAHLASFGTATLTVSKGDTTLAVPDRSGKIGTSVTLSATLTCTDNGLAVSGRTVAFTVDGSGVGSSATNGSGLAELAYSIPEGAGPGSRAIGAQFAGDAAYNGSTGGGTLTVSKGDTSLAVLDRAGQIGASITLSATLTCTPSGHAVSGRTVAFTVDGSDVGSAATNGSGVAELTYVVPVGGGLGVRTIGGAYAGDAAYHGSTGSGTLTVSKADTALAVDSLSGEFNADVTLGAVLTRASDNAPLDGRVVAFSVEGTGVGDGSTDATGRAEVPYTIPEAPGRGPKTVQADYAGDAEHNAGTGTGTLTVIGWPTALAVTDAAGTVSQTVVLSANLQRTDTSTPLEGRTVSFTVQGTAAGSGTTDASGDVSVSYAIPDTLGSGALELRAQFAGDTAHEPAEGTATLTVSKAGTTQWTIDRTGIITTLTILRQFDLKRTTDNALLQGKTITYRIDGSVVGTAATDASGDSLLNWIITDGPATRTITTEFAGDGAYTSSSANATLTAQTVATKMVGVNRTAQISAYTILRAWLYRFDNAPLPGKSVSFLVDGTLVGSAITQMRSGLADAQLGYIVPDGAGAGVRTIVANWAGDGGYLPSSATSTLTAQKTTPYIWVMPRTCRVGHPVSMYAYFRRLPDYQKQGNKPVDFRVDGTLIHSMNTDGNGVAYFIYQTTQPVGTYTIRCEYAGDAWVNPGFGEATLNVVP